MTGSPSMFDNQRLKSNLVEKSNDVQGQSATAHEGGKKKQPNRQLLSCTKCRERKVKCDRTKPCSACCARGHPRECEFIADDGDYTPIQQSYELKKLRKENSKLKALLRASRISIEEDENDWHSSNGRLRDSSSGISSRRPHARQRRFQASERSDNIYFGTPGLATLIAEFASTNLNSYSAPERPSHLAYAIPQGVDMFAPRDLPLFPFATIFSWSMDDCVPQLLRCLPRQDKLYRYLDAFSRRACICFFPYMPAHITKSEVERFLADAKANTEKCPDMLALVFAALALGSQHGVWDSCGEKWDAGAAEEEASAGNLFVAAAMQALRMASYMNRPTLLAIQTLILIGPYLTNSGRFLDAWTLFGTTIRLAQSIGLHRDPKLLDPAPPNHQDVFMRRSLWWWILHVDQDYSMTLGRPLGISGIGDCPPPHELTTDARILRFGSFVHQFTILARHILGTERLSNGKVDELTDSLYRLLETMPEALQFSPRWLDMDFDLPEWPLNAMAAVLYCKAQNCLILLNRQRSERPRQASTTSHDGAVKSSPPNPSINVTSSPLSDTPAFLNSSLRGRPLVLSCCENILTAFIFFFQRLPAALTSWALSQQAFNSCMILVLDAIQAGSANCLGTVQRAFAVFVELDKLGVHALASLAVERISWALDQFRKMHHETDTGDGKQSRTDRMKPGRASTIRTQEAVKSEATSSSDIAQDAVMGNTGMMLLEDPGLQPHIGGVFSPLAWDMHCDETQRAQERRFTHEAEQQTWNEVSSATRNRTEEFGNDHEGRLNGTVRSSELVRGIQESGPAPLQQHQVPPTEPRDLHIQPQGLTFSARSSYPTAASTHSIHPQQRQHVFTDRPPPHFRNHSYPSLQQSVSAPTAVQDLHAASSPGGPSGANMQGQAAIPRRTPGLSLANSQPILHDMPGIVSFPMQKSASSGIASNWFGPPGSTMYVASTPTSRPNYGSAYYPRDHALEASNLQSDSQVATKAYLTSQYRFSSAEHDIITASGATRVPTEAPVSEAGAWSGWNNARNQR